MTVKRSMQSLRCCLRPGSDVRRSSGWLGVGAPKTTPNDIIEKLNKAINASLDDPTHRGRLANLGATVLTGSPSDFAKLVAEETEKWAKAVKLAGIKAN